MINKKINGNPKTSNKINKIKSRKRISLKDEEENDENILVPDSIENKENIKESKNFINKALHIDYEKNEDNNKAVHEISKDKKEGLYIYIDEDNNKYLYSFQKVSKDGNYFELRCRVINNCKGRAKYNIQTGDINITQKCAIFKYEDHNYIKEEIIRNNKISPVEMEDELYQKIIFKKYI